MSDSKKRLIIDFAGGLLLAFGVACLKGLFAAETALSAVSALCDGFFAAAVILLGLGALGYVRNDGAFDAAFFSIRKVLQLKWQSLGDWREEYHEYKAKKKTNRASPKPQIVSGLVYLGATGVCLAAYLIMGG